MNILYINHYAGSKEMGMDFRQYYLSREWVKLGHKVSIFAGDYSHLRQSNPKVVHDFQQEMIDGIEYVWIKTGTYSGNGVRRALTMERFVRKLFFHSKLIADKYQPDVVIAASTYPLDTYPAQRIAKIARAKYIHEVHDMWPSTLYEVGGMSKHHPFVMLMQMAENSAYRHCDKCISIAPYTKEYMIQHGLRPDKFVNIQNGVAEDDWTNQDKIPVDHEEFFSNFKDKFIVGYFGGHALSNALDILLDTAKTYLDHDKNTVFVLVGDGVEKKRLIERKEKENIKNVFFLPSVSKKAIPDLLRFFDCSIMIGKPSPLYRFGLALNKMFDSMMAGIPIICAFNAPQSLVSIYNCGLECDPSDIAAIIRAIQRIQNLSMEERIQMGQNGKKAILEHFTYKQLAGEYLINIEKE